MKTFTTVGMGRRPRARIETIFVCDDSPVSNRVEIFETETPTHKGCTASWTPVWLGVFVVRGE